ncbi:MAG: methyltransferase domain-containing protein [Polyangiales bacterium]
MTADSAAPNHAVTTPPRDDCVDVSAPPSSGEFTCDDDLFDAKFPPEVRRRSAMFWTPIAVAHRAGELLADLGVERVLDIGSGPGKFCVAAATRAPKVRFVGVEQRAHRVEVAREVARRLGVTNTRFEVGDATRVDLTRFDAVYMFNPFAENGFAEVERFDQTVELTEVRLLHDVARVERAVAASPAGMLVLTYHTYGGRFPDSFDLFHCERAGTGWLRIWRRRAGGRRRAGITKRTTTAARSRAAQLVAEQGLFDEG